MIFESRRDAGKRLSAALMKYRRENPIILALPRGGVVVGFMVSESLRAPLDILVTKKLGVPFEPELGLGAIAEGGIMVLDRPLIRLLGIEKGTIEKVIGEEKVVLEARVKLYRGERKFPEIRNRIVVLVDDGLATGLSAKAAIMSARKFDPRKVVFAAPVCPAETAKNLRFMVDDFICLLTPFEFTSVGVWYRNFEQVTDEEVIKILKASRSGHRLMKMVQAENSTIV